MSRVGARAPTWPLAQVVNIEALLELWPHLAGEYTCFVTIMWIVVGRSLRIFDAGEQREFTRWEIGRHSSPVAVSWIRVCGRGRRKCRGETFKPGVTGGKKKLQVTTTFLLPRGQDGAGGREHFPPAEHGFPWRACHQKGPEAEQRRGQRGRDLPDGAAPHLVLHGGRPQGCGDDGDPGAAHVRWGLWSSGGFLRRLCFVLAWCLGNFCQGCSCVFFCSGFRWSCSVRLTARGINWSTNSMALFVLYFFFSWKIKNWY